MNNDNGNTDSGVSAPLPPPVNPLDKLESAVAAASQSVQDAGTSAVPPAETPQEQFNNQFGSGAVPPVAEPPAVSDAQLSEIKAAAELLAQDPKDLAIKAAAEDLKKQVSDSIDKFLAEATKGKPAA